MLGEDPFIASSWGIDCGAYEKHFQALGIRTEGILKITDQYSAQAIITTDRLGNQLTSFHEGAMQFAAQAKADSEVLSWGIITPMNTPVMKTHVTYLNERLVPMVLDVGQASAYLTGEDLRWLIEHVEILTMSSYEWAVVQQKTAWSVREVLERVSALIVTHAADGATLYTADTERHFKAARIRTFVSPVGCGDAFRSGLLYGLVHRLKWQTTMQIATLMGAIKAEVATPQGYRFTKDCFCQRYFETFGQTLDF